MVVITLLAINIPSMRLLVPNALKKGDYSISHSNEKV